MKQLSGTDNLFLRMERGHQFMHVAGLGIYDPSTAPEGRVRFKDILRFFESRLDASPIFRRRLVNVPFDVDRPYWIEEADIDVEFHVRHVALPHPGDWRQLCIQVARIHSRPLDRSKPLWEAYVIEQLNNVPGIPPGSFALYIKFHHCAVDGEAGTEILEGDPLDQRRGFQRRRLRRHALPRSRADGARAVFARDRPWREARAAGGAILARDRCAPRDPRRGLAGRAAAAARGGRVAEGGADSRRACASRRRRASTARFPRTASSRWSACRSPRCARSASRSRGRRSTTCS